MLEIGKSLALVQVRAPAFHSFSLCAQHEVSAQVSQREQRILLSPADIHSGSSASSFKTSISNLTPSKGHSRSFQPQITGSPGAFICQGRLLLRSQGCRLFRCLVRSTQPSVWCTRTRSPIHVRRIWKKCSLVSIAFPVRTVGPEKLPLQQSRLPGWNQVNGILSTPDFS